MKALKRLSNISKYGLGAQGRARKQADKEQLRHERFHNPDLWEHGEAGARRKYASYEEYVAHQASKLDRIAPRLHEKEDEDFAEFRRRFATCAALDGARSVLCLGARLGTEVRALHDLDPGERNPYVLPGDFHRIVFPGASIDAVYTNALDHVFSLEQLVGEVQRLLRPGGIFVADLELGSEEGFVPGEYEAVMWRDHGRLIDQIKELGCFELEQVRDLGRTRRDQWTQVVFRKPA
jgi:SAM-dependent methyltransferase